MGLQLAAGLLAGVSAASVSCTARADYAWNFPPPVTPIARDILAIHNEFMIIITVLFAVVFAIMIYSLVRHRKSVGHPPARFTGPTGAVQWFWTLVPFAILLFIDFVLMGIPAFHAVLDMEDTRTKADMVVKVTGLQWKWQYEYPGTDIKYLSTMTTPQAQIDNLEAKGQHYLLEVDNPLVLPVGKKVRVLLTAGDVIHTWWVPQFGVKRDAVPGFIRETWVKIEEPGTYRGQCAELCGKGHGFMPVVVEALPEDQYNAWLERKKAEFAQAAESVGRAFSRDELMAHGEKVYAQQCAVCHGPQGQGIAGAFPPLSGSPAIAAPLLSPEGRLIPDRHVDRVLNGKPGTAMQAFRNTLSPVDLAAVITFERNALGNARGDMIQPAQIRALLAGETAAAAPTAAGTTGASAAAAALTAPAAPGRVAAADTAVRPAASVPPAAGPAQTAPGAPTPAMPPSRASGAVAAAPPKAAAGAPGGGQPATLSRAELMSTGQAIYSKHCAACHGPEGKGVPPVFPPLTGSPLVNGPALGPGGHLDRVLNGKPGTTMQAFRTTLSDTEIAAVVTYERNALGNSRGDLIQPAQVGAQR
jgi:cytochrome c oxidase subunit 2